MKERGKISVNADITQAGYCVADENLSVALSWSQRGSWGAQTWPNSSLYWSLYRPQLLAYTGLSLGGLMYIVIGRSTA
jgi:hypothetical protein